jgi:hypothetical protein
MALEALNVFDQILCNQGETLNTIAVNYLKLMLNEKSGLKVVSLDRSRSRLFTLEFSAKLCVQWQQGNIFLIAEL